MGALLYVGHAALELALGAIKLRGRYQHEPAGSKSLRSETYCRHHGFSILSLSLLGAMVWWQDLIDTPTGRISSTCLAVFHGGAVISFLHAWSCGSMPMTKVAFPHLPFALGFAWHAMTAPA